MTTSLSPFRVLKAQATKIAQTLKGIERGELVGAEYEGLALALQAGQIKFGVVMDDKLITIEMTTAQIREVSQNALVEMILKHMRGHRRESRKTVH